MVGKFMSDADIAYEESTRGGRKCIRRMNVWAWLQMRYQGANVVNRLTHDHSQVGLSGRFVTGVTGEYRQDVAKWSRGRRSE